MRSSGSRLCRLLMFAIVLFSAHRLDAAALPFDSSSPVIYDNDGALESGFTDVYVMALASAGVINLRGIISTGTNGEQPPFIPRSEDSILLERREMVAKGRRSGLQNIPDPSPGPGVSMSSRRPASGRIEDTPPFGAKGSWLIVNEARKATAARPLFVIMGGQGSSLADAYLLDNSIADKVVAVWLVGNRRSDNGIYDAYEYNAYVDSWATYIIFERLRVFAIPVDSKDHVAYTPKSSLTQLPDTEIRQLMLETRWPRSATTYSEPDHNWDGMTALALTRSDLVLDTKRLAFDHWETDQWGGRYPIPVWREDPNGRALVAWQVDPLVATQEWWSRILDPQAWGTSMGEVPFKGVPWAVPGVIEAENFDEGGTNIAYVDNTNNWTYVEWFNPIRFLEHVDIRASATASAGYMVISAEAGEWMRYSISAASSDVYSTEVRVASQGSGGTFHIEIDGVDRTGPLQVPDTGGWETWQSLTRSGISLSAGPHLMRIVLDSNGATGQVGNFDYVRMTGSPLASVTVLASDGYAAEDGPDSGSFLVSRSGDLSRALTVYYSVGGSATNGIDYGSLSGTVSFQPGQASTTIVVLPIKDNVIEGTETVIVTLSANSAYIVGAPSSATVMIADSAVAPTPASVALSFDGLARDRVGQGEFALRGDGKLDGVFSVTLKSGSGNRTVTRLYLANTPGGIWDTQAFNGFWSLGAASGLDTALLNASTDSVNFPLNDGATFKIFASDHLDAMFANGVVFTLKVDFSDGSSATASTTINALPTVPAVPTIALSFDGSVRDRVGQAEFALGGDGKADGGFTVTLNSGSGNRTVTRLYLTNAPGGIWDTQAFNGFWSLGAASGLDTALLNASNDSVNFPLSDGASFKIFASDHLDAMFANGVVFTLKVDFSDGSSAIASTTINALPTVPAVPTIALSFDGLVRDRVGQAEFTLGGDEKADGVFTVTLNSGSGNRTVTRLYLTNTSGGIWDTQAFNGFWSLGAASGLDTALLNASNDSVNFPLNDGATFKIFASDHLDAMFVAGVVFTLKVDFSDGSSATASATINPLPAPPVQPTIALSFDGLVRDRVGQAEFTLGGDGQADGVFTVKLNPGSGNRTVTRLYLTNAPGGIWDTQAFNGFWSLGVANGLDTALLNASNDSVNFPLSDGASFKIFASDFRNAMYLNGVVFTLQLDFADGNSVTASTTINNL